jgi:hypothetical protein
MGSWIGLFVVGAGLVAVYAMVQRLVSFALTAGIVAFLGLGAYYWLIDHTPEPIAARVESLGEGVGAAGAKAAGALGGEASKVGARVATDASAEASKAAKDLGAAAADGVKEGAKKAVGDLVGGGAVAPKPAPPAAGPAKR